MAAACARSDPDRPFSSTDRQTGFPPVCTAVPNSHDQRVRLSGNHYQLASAHREGIEKISFAEHAVPQAELNRGARTISRYPSRRCPAPAPDHSACGEQSRPPLPSATLQPARPFVSAQ